MTTITYKQALEIMNSNPESCFYNINTVKHMILPPKCIGQMKKGVIEQLNSELRLSSDSFGGALIAYNNIQLLQQMGNVHDEKPFIHFDIQADFIVFKPVIGCKLKGVVNKISPRHIGCLVHNCFNASIPQPHGSSEKWTGFQLSMGQEFSFEVTGIYAYNKVLSLRGKLPEFSSTKTSRKLGANEDTSLTTLDNLQPLSSPSKKSKKKHGDPDLNCSGITNELDFCSNLELTSEKKKRNKKKKKKDKSFSNETFDQTDSEHDKSGLLHKTHTPVVVKEDLGMTPGKHKKKKHRKEEDGDASKVFDQTVEDKAGHVKKSDTSLAENNCSEMTPMKPKKRKRKSDDSNLNSKSVVENDSSVTVTDTSVINGEELPKITHKMKSERRKSRGDGSVHLETFDNSHILNKSQDTCESVVSTKNKKKRKHSESNIKTELNWDVYMESSQELFSDVPHDPVEIKASIKHEDVLNPDSSGDKGRKKRKSKKHKGESHHGEVSDSKNVSVTVGGTGNVNISPLSQSMIDAPEKSKKKHKHKKKHDPNMTI